MTASQKGAALPACFERPHISLMGEVNESMTSKLVDGLRNPPDEGDIALEVTTPGGDAELGRRMVLEVDLARERLKDRRLVFFGKTEVYSAGVTLMSAFAREDRYLSHEAVLLIHCRQLDKTVELSGPIRSSLPELKALIHQLELGLELEVDNFKRLIEGSDVSLDEVTEKALYNWYVPAEEALERGLIAGIY
jgi:ATP-dependent protease ClpP protease subunit